MAYTKTKWNDNAAPAITADALNNIENGIDKATMQSGILSGFSILDKVNELYASGRTGCHSFVSWGLPTDAPSGATRGKTNITIHIPASGDSTYVSVDYSNENGQIYCGMVGGGTAITWTKVATNPNTFISIPKNDSRWNTSVVDASNSELTFVLRGNTVSVYGTVYLKAISSNSVSLFTQVLPTEYHPSSRYAMSPCYSASFPYAPLSNASVWICGQYASAVGNILIYKNNTSAFSFYLSDSYTVN